MSANEIHLGDIGTIFDVTVMDGTTAVNISTATVKQFILKKPDGSSVTKTASFKVLGADGVLTYTTLANDLDQAGTWSLQVYIEMPTGKWHSDTYSFVVYLNLP
jgi:hypothetical protein